MTGVDAPIGRHAVRLLVASGGEVRVFVGTDVDGAAPDRLVATLRGAGCKVAVGDLVDDAHVETALEQVHTVLHLLGRPTDDPETHLERTATVIGAAIGAGCRRLVLLSDLALGAADEPAGAAGNPWLSALAEAEEMAADAPMESVVLRAAVVHGAQDALTTALASGALGADPPGSHWPVAAVDVATVAVLADRQRDLDTELHVVVPVAGPQQMATADYVAALATVLPAAPGDPLPGHAVDLLHRTVDRPDGAVGGSGRRVVDGPVPLSG